MMHEINDNDFMLGLYLNRAIENGDSLFKVHRNNFDGIPNSRRDCYQFAIKHGLRIEENPIEFIFHLK